MKLTNERLLILYRFFFRLGIALYPTNNSNSNSLQLQGWGGHEQIFFKHKTNTTCI